MSINDTANSSKIIAIRSLFNTVIWVNETIVEILKFSFFYLKNNLTKPEATSSLANFYPVVTL